MFVTLFFVGFSLTGLAQKGGCVSSLPSVVFASNKSNLTPSTQQLLGNISDKMKSSPKCSILITGYPAASKSGQYLCNKRVEALKKYLIENAGIAADRIQGNWEVGGGDANTINHLPGLYFLRFIFLFFCIPQAIANNPFCALHIPWCLLLLLNYPLARLLLLFLSEPST